MTRSPLRRIALLLLVGLTGLAVHACRDSTGPDSGSGRFVDLTVSPAIPSGAESIARKAHAVVTHANGSVALDTTVDLAGTFSAQPGLVAALASANGQPVFQLHVELDDADGENFTISLEILDANGNIVFTSQPVQVNASAGNPPPTIIIPMQYVGPGANAVSITVSPGTATINAGASIDLTAEARDQNGAIVPNAPIIWVSLDPAVASVPNPASGHVVALASRGPARIRASLLTGQAAGATITVTPVAASIAIQSGSAQTGSPGSAAQPLVVKAVATDGLGIAGIPVNFTIQSGGGTLAASQIVTDANGLASVGFTFGATVGATVVQASAAGLAGSPLTFNLSSALPAGTQVVFSTQPANSLVGTTMSPVVVELRDAAGNRLTTFNGTITIALSGAPAGVALQGTTSVAATGGVAQFTGLSVSGLAPSVQLVASVAGGPSGTSATFAVGAAPAASLQFAATVPSVTATVALPAIRVEAFNALGQFVPSYTGAVTLSALNLPPGVVMSGTATVNAINGQATFTGIAFSGAATNVRLQATGAGIAGTFQSNLFNVNALPAGPSTTLAVPNVGVTQSTAITPVTPVVGSGGTAPLVYSISPALPAGLVFNAVNGQITGTPTGTLATTAFTVTVTDNFGITSNKTFNLTVNTALSTTQAVPARSVTQNSAIVTFTPVTTSGGTAPITFGISPALPAGLSINTSTGAISGTPTGTLAATTFTVTATDAAGATSSKTFQLTVNSALTTTVVVPSTTGTAGAPLSFTPVTSAGGTAPVTWAITAGGALPAGVTLNASTGQISGTPAGAFANTTFTITATDAAGATSSKTFQLVVNGPLTTTVVIPATAATAGIAVSITPVTAAGGTAPITFAITAGGALPGGLTLDANTGQISGTPAAAFANTTFTITATDGVGATSSKTFQLTVNAALTTTVAVPATTGVVGTPLSFTPVTASGGTAPVTWAMTAGGALPAGLTLNAGTGQISGTPTAPFANVTFTITASDVNGATSSKTFQLAVNQAPAAGATTTITALPTSLSVGSSSTITVQAKTAAGANRGIGGDAVVLTPSGGSLSVVTDNGDGTYTATLTTNTPATITINGTINGQAIGTPASVTFVAGAPASVVIAAGDAQSANVGATVATTPKVTVLDQFGNPVGAGIPVAFTITGGNGSVSGGSVVTDASGQASPTSWTLGAGGVGCSAGAVTNCSRNALTATVTGGTNPAVAFKAYIPPTIGSQLYYQAIGNNTLSIGSNVGLLTTAFSINGNGANGTGATFTVTTPAPAGSQSGTATIAADGSFTYLSAPAYVDATANAGETFTYTVSDGLSTSTVNSTLKVQVPLHVWYVRPGYAGTSVGSDAQPFKDFSATAGTGVQSVAVASDLIVIQTGSGTAAGGTLKATQTVRGQGAATPFTFTPGAGFANTGVTFTVLATGTSPSVASLALSTNNTLVGFTLAPTGATALTGSGFGLLTVGEMIINASGGAAIVVDNGGLQGNFTSVTSNGGASPVFLTAVGTIGTVALGTGSLSGATGADAFRLNSSAGTWTYAGNITGNGNGAAISVAGGTASITFSGNITNASATQPVVTIGTSHTGTVTFNTGTVSSASGLGLQFSAANGTYNFNGTTTLTGSAGRINIAGGSTGTFTFSSGTSLTNTGTANAFRVNASAATVTFAGTIVHGTSGTPLTATGISIASNTGGTVTVSGSSISLFTSTAAAVNMTTNTGATINFTGGGLAITTTSGNGFVATGGGTVSVTGANNTIASGTGTALNVSNTTIGASGLTFRSVSANGGTNGIILNTTGANAGLTVTGDGTNTTQGGNGSGGTIQNLTGADGTTSGTGASNGLGIGVYLVNTKSVVLRRMNLHDFSNFAIEGETLTDFTLQYSAIGGANGSSAAQEEGGLRFTGLAGVVTIDNNTITGGAYDNVRVEQTGGALTDLVISNNAITNNGAGGHNGVGLNLSGGTTTTHITGNTLAANRNDHIGVITSGAANANVVIGTNTLTGGHASAQSQGIRVASTAFTGAVTYNINGNSINGAVGTAAIIASAGSSTGTYSGQIANNVIGTTGLNGSGSSTGDGILVAMDGDGSHVTSIAGNNIRQYFGRGIAVKTANNPGTTGTIDAGITSNTLIERAAGGTGPGLHVLAGSGAASANLVCANIAANTLTGAGSNGGAGTEDFFLEQLFGTTLKLPNYAGGSTDNAAVVAFIQAQNVGSPTGGAANSGSGGGFAGGGACATPTIPS